MEWLMCQCVRFIKSDFKPYRVQLVQELTKITSKAASIMRICYE